MTIAIGGISSTAGYYNRSPYAQHPQARQRGVNGNSRVQSNTENQRASGSLYV